MGSLAPRAGGTANSTAAKTIPASVTAFRHSVSPLEEVIALPDMTCLLFERSEVCLDSGLDLTSETDRICFFSLDAENAHPGDLFHRPERKTVSWPVTN